jgi:hypothetical protein
MKLLLIAISALFAAAPAQAQQQDAKELVGTWKVVAVKATSGDKVNYPLGEKPEGYITITPNRMWLLFVDGTRKAPAAAALTDAESIEAMKTHASWTGKYTANEQTPDGIKVAAMVDSATSQALAAAAAPRRRHSTAPSLVNRQVWPAADRIAAWLHETALRLFPDSPYAKEHAG